MSFHSVRSPSTTAVGIIPSSMMVAPVVYQSNVNIVILNLKFNWMQEPIDVLIFEFFIGWDNEMPMVQHRHFHCKLIHHTQSLSLLSTSHN